MDNKLAKIIGTIAAIVGIIVGTMTLIKDCSDRKEIIYQGSVQDKETKEPIAGAEITFPGYTNEIFPCQTDNLGFFKCKLSKEYPDIEMHIAHKDYGTVVFHRTLTKSILKDLSDNILLPSKKLQQTNIPEATIVQKPTEKLESILNKNKPDNREKIEATGVSGYKINSRWALEEAEKDAYNKLLRQLNKTSIAYEINNEKSFAYLVDGEGYQAKVVIYTYK